MATWGDNGPRTNRARSRKFVTTETKRIIVDQVTFASVLGGEIDPTVLYVIDGTIDCAGVSIEVPPGGLSIAGHGIDLSFLTCSEAGFSLFTSPPGGSGNVFMKDITLIIDGAGSEVYALTDATGDNAVELDRVNFTNCSSLGTLTGFRQGLETGTGRFFGTPELELDGTWSGGYRATTTLVRALDAGFTGSLFKAGATFTMASRFITDMNADIPANASICDFAPANFTGPGLMLILGADITRDDVSDPTDPNLMPNISRADPVAFWRSNSGLPNTFVGGQMEIETEVATTISTIDVWETLAGTWSLNDPQHFDQPQNEQLRHLGVQPFEFRVLASLAIVGPANDVVGVRLRIWDDSASVFIDTAEQVRVINNVSGPRDVAFMFGTTIIQMGINDYAFAQIRNKTSTGDLTVEIDSLWSVAER